MELPTLYNKLLSGLFLLLIFSLSTSAYSFAIDIPQVTHSPEIEAYFEQADEIDEDKGYGYEKVMKRKVIRPLRKIADIHVKQQRYLEAENIYLRLLEIEQRMYGEDNPQTKGLWITLSGLYLDTGEHVKRLEAQENILRLKAEQFGDGEFSLLGDMKQIANTYQKMGAYTNAVGLYEKILRTYEENDYKGEYYNASLTRIYYSLASLYIELGDYARAEPYYKRSLLPDAPVEDEITDISKLSIIKLHSYGFILQFVGKYREAENLYNLMLEAAGKDNMQTATVLAQRGAIYNKLGSYDKALADNKQSVVIFARLYGKDHPITAYAKNNLAES